MATTTRIGRSAEEAVVSHIKSLGHSILAQNWRNRWCEIDIISKRKNRLYFIEVKYRAVDAWGNGLEYITPKKLKQMRFAAELWLSENDWTGEVAILAVSTYGEPIRIGEVVEI